MKIEIGVGFSKGAISSVTDKIIPMLQEWKVCPLEEKSEKMVDTSQKLFIQFLEFVLMVRKRYLDSISMRVKVLSSGYRYLLIYRIVE